MKKPLLNIVLLFPFAELVYYTKKEMVLMQKYYRMITEAVINIKVIQEKFPDKKLIATTSVVNKNTQQPMPLFKVTWIINNEPKGQQPSLNMDFPQLPKVLNVTVLATLPIKRFHLTSTQIFYPKSGECDVHVFQVSFFFESK